MVISRFRGSFSLPLASGKGVEGSWKAGVWQEREKTGRGMWRLGWKEGGVSEASAGGRGGLLTEGAW